MDAKKIRHRLVDLDLTVAEVARRAGYSREWTSKVIHGREISAEAKKKILQVIEQHGTKTRAA